MEDIIKVMLSGLPGKMATIVGESIAETDGIELTPFTLASDKHAGLATLGGENMQYISGREGTDYPSLGYFVKYSPSFVVVDFTTPDAALDNAKLYVRHGLNFVMGTTGFDVGKLEEIVRNSNISAVVAPNMAMEIVAFQNILGNLHKKGNGKYLEGCQLHITESHQQRKKDTSGTAIAAAESFYRFGIMKRNTEIKSIRDREEQRKIGIPEEYLEGHAWHTYEITAQENNPNLTALANKLFEFLNHHRVFADYSGNTNWNKNNGGRITRTSKDGTVAFGLEYNAENRQLTFTHNINGRDVYARGTLEAIRFLHKSESLVERRVYSMLDVVKSFSRHKIYK